MNRIGIHIQEMLRIALCAAALLCLLCLGYKAGAQNRTLLPVKQDGKWGYIDLKGQIVIAPQYDAAMPFEKGRDYTHVMKDGKILVINKANLQLATIEGQDLKYLDGNTYVAAERGGLWQLLYLPTGQLVFPDRCEKIEKIAGTHFFQYTIDQKTGVVSSSGAKGAYGDYDEIKYYHDDLFKLYRNGLFGLADSMGKIIVPPLCRNMYTGQDSVIYYEDSTGHWGAMDKNGYRILDCEWEKITGLDKVMTVLQQHNELQLYNLRSRKVISRGRYDAFTGIDPGLAIAWKDSLAGLLDTAGQELLPTLYTGIYKISGSQFINIQQNDKMGLASLQGKILFKPQYDWIGELKGNLALVSDQGSFGLINTHGQQLLPPIYDEIIVEDNHVKARSKGTLKLLEVDGEGRLAQQRSYAHFVNISINARRSYSDGKVSLSTATITKGGWYQDKYTFRWGLMDTSGAIRIVPQFDEVQRHGNFTLVSKKIPGNYSFVTGSRGAVFRYVYGLVVDSTFRILFQPKYLYIDMDGLAKTGYHYTRALLADKRFVLLYASGKVVDFGDMIYVDQPGGQFVRYCRGGRLSALPSKDGYGSIESVNTFFNLLSSGKGVDIFPANSKYKSKRLYIFTEKSKWGYLGDKGEIKIKPAYDFAFPMSQDEAIIKVNDQWGTIASKGNYRIFPIYPRLDYLPNSTAQLLVNTVNTELYGYINEQGEVISLLSFSDAGDFKEERAWVKIGNRYTFINKNMQAIADTSFRRVRNFSEGRAAVCNHKYRWGFIDKDGQTILPYEYRLAGDFHNGLAWVRDVKNRYGYIGEDGNWVVKPRFDNATDLNNYGLSLVSRNQKYAVLNSSGKVLTHFRIIRKAEWKEGMLVAKADEQVWIIDSLGQIVRKFRNAYASDYSCGLASVRQYGRQFFIDKDGNKALDDNYIRCTDFEGGYCHFIKDDHRKRIEGVMDLSGKVMFYIPEERFLSGFRNGLALCRGTDGRAYFVHPNGKTAFEKTFADATPFVNGHARVKNDADDDWMTINQGGMVIIQPKYASAGDYSEGLCKIKFTTFKGIMKPDDTQVLPPEYEYIEYYPNEQVYRIEGNNAIGYMKMDGTWLWAVRR